ncbi:spermidine/putrescine ABC transporter substrate-binding protein [Clostridia bacterium]|nr:spermidine/putrescine ABC transporter substrate-binding protein [Clostridia bacterium]
MKMTKKIVACLMAVLVIVAASSVLLTGCGSSKEEINVFNWGEYISVGEDDSMDVIAEFEKQYNIKVNYTNYETNEEMYNLLKNSNSSYDVIFPSDYMIGKLIKEDMLDKINFDNVPNYENIMEEYKNLPFDPNNEYSVPYSGGVVAMVYNTEMIKENPDSFAALWSDKYKGNILMINNSRDAMAIAMQLKGITPDVVTKEDVDTAAAYLKEQKPILKKYAMDQTFTEMEGDQAAIAPYYAGDIAAMIGNNDKLDYILPKEGSNKFIDSMCIPKTSKNKDLAEKFINFMLEAETAKENATYLGYTTPNKAAYDILDDDIKNNELMYPPKEYLDKCYYFSNIPDDVYNYMQEKFLQVQSK